MGSVIADKKSKQFKGEIGPLISGKRIFGFLPLYNGDETGEVKNLYLSKRRAENRYYLKNILVARMSARWLASHARSAALIRSLIRSRAHSLRRSWENNFMSMN